jgi:excisionase family DNA binding protein
MQEKLVYSPNEISKLLHLNRNSIYKAIHEGTIPHLRIGKRILIPRHALEKMLAAPAENGGKSDEKH